MLMVDCLERFVGFCRFTDAIPCTASNRMESINQSNSHEIVYPHSLGAAIILTARNEWFVIIFIRLQCENISFLLKAQRTKPSIGK